MTSLSELQQRFLNIATDGRLSPKQKSNFLALEAEACIPYMPISEALREAMSDGVICDMFEGHAPFKPRYVLPDYAKFLSQGSEYLELPSAEDFDDALNMLTIIYHHDLSSCAVCYQYSRVFRAVRRRPDALCRRPN